MSYAIFVGKNLTADGRSYLGGYGDEPSSHWLSITPRKQHPAGSTISVGVTPEAMMPGVISQIPQVSETARYINVDYSFYRGVPAPITNGGLNEYGVAVRDIWSTSRQALIEMTPTDQRGPNYSDLARLVLERARTAREGVELIGDLIAKYGYSTYGGNSHFIADHDEGWVVIEFAGGKGLWAAQRVSADEIRASRPGYILEIPIDFAADPTILAAPHLVDFAVEQGWFDPAGQTVFNVNEILGDGNGRWAGIQWIEGEMRQRAAERKITIKDMMWAVRTERLTGDTAGYGQVVPLPAESHSDLRVLWHTQSGSVVTPFVPLFMGTTDIPPEYKQHRYLTSGESSRFVDDRNGTKDESHVPQEIEATRSAFRAIKRLLYWVMTHHEQYLPEVTAMIQAFEGKLLAEHDDILATAQTLYDAQRVDLARRHLTYYVNTELLKALTLIETMTAHFEAKSKLLYGLRETTGYRGAKQIWE